MISNLIQPPKSKYAATLESPADPKHSSNAENCARFFVNSMGEAQRERFKAMLRTGAQCGESIARSYGIPLAEFIAEVQKII